MGKICSRKGATRVYGVLSKRGQMHHVKASVDKAYDRNEKRWEGTSRAVREDSDGKKTSEERIDKLRAR